MRWIRSTKWRPASASISRCACRRGCSTSSRCCRSWRRSARSFRRLFRKGDCQEVVKTEGFSLYDYPVLTCWPDDGGPFITLPMVFSRNPETGKRNCGMYRLQVFDERTTGMHWQTHKQGAEHYRRRTADGKPGRMDVAVAIGSDPATMYSAILPLAARSRRDDDRGFPARQAGRDGEVPYDRSRSSRECGDRARRLRRAGRAAHGGTVRRPYRLLFAGRRVSGVPRDVHHAEEGTRFMRPRLWVRRPWKISIWAKRSSASSCR